MANQLTDCHSSLNVSVCQANRKLLVLIQQLNSQPNLGVSDPVDIYSLYQQKDTEKKIKKKK